MRITEVECHPVRVPGVSLPFHWRDGLAGSPAKGDGAVLRIGTDAGVEGVAMFARPGAGCCWTTWWTGCSAMSWSARIPCGGSGSGTGCGSWTASTSCRCPLLGLVDIALWDLAGRLYDQPVWQVLGGYRNSIPAYASTSTFDSSRNSSTSPTSASRSATAASSCTPGATPAATPRCAWRCANMSAVMCR